MKKPPASRASRYQALCRQAAKRLNKKTSDDLVQHAATLMLARETAAGRMIDGIDLDPAVLLRLDDAIRALIPVEIPKVQIEIIGGSDDAHCHAAGCGGDVIEICTCCGRIPGEDTHQPPKRPPPQLTWNGNPPARSDSALKLVENSTPATPIAPPPSPPPPPPPISPTMAAWNGRQGYNRSARDGGLIKGPAVPHVDPNLPGPATRESYNNNLPVTWNGYMDGRRPYGAADPDQNPNFNSNGSARDPYRAPY